MSGPGYEKSDVTINGIVVFTVCLVVVTAITMGLMAWMYGSFEKREAAAAAEAIPTTRLRQLLPEHPPGPVLQGSPGSNFPLQHPMVEMQAWDALMDKKLASSDWVDRNEGVVSIPIDDAKKLLLQRGLPVRPDPKRHDSGHGSGGQ